MKQSMQAVAMVAFLGCFAILVIAAGSKKARWQEDCHEEWKKGVVPELKEADHKDQVQPVKEVAQYLPSSAEYMIFPVEVLHKML